MSTNNNLESTPARPAEYEVVAGPENYTGFSIGAIVTIVGSLIALASYPLMWWTVVDEPDAGITGFGSIKQPDAREIVFHSNKIHWAVLAGAIVLIIVAIARLLGKFNTEWVRGLAVAALAMVAGVVFAFIGTGEGFAVSTGVYVAVAGTVVALVGAALIYVKR